jgi:hypothetical protein
MGFFNTVSLSHWPIGEHHAATHSQYLKHFRLGVAWTLSFTRTSDFQHTEKSLRMVEKLQETKLESLLKCLGRIPDNKTTSGAHKPSSTILSFTDPK